MRRAMLADLQESLADKSGFRRLADYQKFCSAYPALLEINRVVYTLQQSVGCVGDSFANENQSRKRIGQLFESLVKLIIMDAGEDLMTLGMAK